jgi:hypothetical protein
MIQGVISLISLFLPDSIKGRRWWHWEDRMLFQDNRRRYGIAWAYEFTRFIVRTRELLKSIEDSANGKTKGTGCAGA